VNACDERQSIREEVKHCRFDLRKELCSGGLPLFLSKRELYTVTAELLRNSAPEAACVATAMYVCKPFLQFQQPGMHQASLHLKGQWHECRLQNYPKVGTRPGRCLGAYTQLFWSALTYCLLLTAYCLLLTYRFRTPPQQCSAVVSHMRADPNLNTPL